MRRERHGNKVVCVPVAIVLAAATARADDRDWHVGLNLRTDLGAHSLRLDGGARFGAFDTVIVIDPLYLADGELALDGLVRWEPARPGWALLGGWRAVVVEVSGGARWNQHLLLGATAALPCLVDGVRAQWGFEVALVVLRHGAGLGTDALPADDRLFDLVQPGMFVRLELARGW